MALPAVSCSLPFLTLARFLHYSRFRCRILTVCNERGMRWINALCTYSSFKLDDWKEKKMTLFNSSNQCVTVFSQRSNAILQSTWNHSGFSDKLRYSRIKERLAMTWVLLAISLGDYDGTYSLKSKSKDGIESLHARHLVMMFISVNPLNSWKRVT